MTDQELIAVLRAKGDHAVAKWREADDARDVSHKQYWAGYQAAMFEAIKHLESSSDKSVRPPSPRSGR